MSEHLDQELSALVDGELASGELARVEAHLAGCARCRATLEDLKRLVRRAGSLDETPPPLGRDLWPGIVARIAAPSTGDVTPIEWARRGRRVAFTVPQLAAAAVALIAVSAGTALLWRGDQPPPAASAPALGAGSAAATTVALPSRRAVESYHAAIRELELALATRRGLLDTATLRVLEQSIAIIDAAIEQAYAALERDPNNGYLNRHLQRALDRKLDVLRQAATLPVAS